MSHDLAALAPPRNLAEYDRPQRKRIAPFQEFRTDVEKGEHREDKHLVPIAGSEFEAFVGKL